MSALRQCSQLLPRCSSSNGPRQPATCLRLPGRTQTLNSYSFTYVNRQCSPARPSVSTRAFFDTAWNPNLDAASIAPQLFAFSLFPYLAFLFFLTKSGKTPTLTLVGFYFLLAFVGATIPAGIYAKVHYGKALANVDWLHGSAESLLTITNLLIVLGLRQAIRDEEAKKSAAAASTSAQEQKQE